MDSQSQQPVQAPQAAPLAPQGEMKTSGFAITSLVLGIIALFPNPFTSLILGILALVFGIIAHNKIKKGLAGGKGMSIAGIVLGSIGILMAVVMAIMFAILVSTMARELPGAIRNMPVQGFQASSTFNYNGQVNKY